MVWNYNVHELRNPHRFLVRTHKGWGRKLERHMRRWEVNIKTYLSEICSNCEGYIYVTQDRDQ